MVNALYFIYGPQVLIEDVDLQALGTKLIIVYMLRAQRGPL